jgi:hypothetical protein
MAPSTAAGGDIKVQPVPMPTSLTAAVAAAPKAPSRASREKVEKGCCWLVRDLGCPR